MNLETKQNTCIMSAFLPVCLFVNMLDRFVVASFVHLFVTSYIRAHVRVSFCPLVWSLVRLFCLGVSNRLI